MEDCQECGSDKAAGTRHRSSQLRPVSGSLEFAAMDILGPLEKTLNEKQFVVVITDYHMKLTKAVPKIKMSVLSFSSSFMKIWIMTYGIPAHVPMDDRTHFTIKFSQTLCLILDTKQMTATLYHAQTS